MRYKWPIGLIAFFLMPPFPATGEEFHVTPLTDDERAVLSSIEENRVLETVAYLASDEMNGRDSPSKELNTAAQFVAERFQTAGLTGPGPDGTFFQTTEMFQTSAPQLKAVLSSVTSNDIQLTVLTGISDSLTLSSVVHDNIADNKAIPDGEERSIVVIDEFALPPRAVDDPVAVLITYVRRTAPMVRQGTKVVLVRVADDSLLFDAAAAFQKKPMTIPPQFEPKCAILLVSKAQPLDGEVTLEVPANVRMATPVHNVIGVLRGSDPVASKQAVIVSAHLDHIGPARRGEDKVNNGADDNASGVTGVLMLADAFSQLKVRPKRSVVFLTFWGEEKGLLGSKYFVEHPLWDLHNVVCNINLEMIGRPEVNAVGNAWATGWSHSSLGPQMAAGAIRASVSIAEHKEFSEMLYTRSDNASFAAKAVIAHSFSAGSLHSDYHQPSDEVEKLNIPHMTTIIQGLLAGILPIANGEMTPQPNP